MTSSSPLLRQLAAITAKQLDLLLTAKLVSCLALASMHGCTDNTGLPDHTLPVITSMSPRDIPLGSAATLVTVAGTGFVEDTRVRLDGSDRTTTWHSDTRLTVSLPATDFFEPGTRVVTAYSPPPGGGSSTPAQLLVSPSSPIIDSVSPAALPVGQASMPVTVFGTGFRSGAVVRWDGSDRPTIRVSGGQLVVSLASTDLALPGTHTITVHHTTMPASHSEGREFGVGHPAPTIVAASPSYAIVGRAFTLTVTGSSFVPGAAVHWNGAPRQTGFVSSNQLTARIEGADVASADTITIRVVNPSPTMGPSNELLLAVRPPGHHVLPLVVGDLEWDALRGVLYASVRSSDPSLPNRVVAVDPMTGEVLRTVVVGSDPRTLALSDDLSVLYVALDGAAAIRRIDLTTFTAGLQFPMVSHLGRILYADDIAVMPGHPGTVAVTHQVHGFSEGRKMGIAVYDDGLARGSLIEGGTVLAFANAHTLYGFDGWTTGHRLTRMIVSGAGPVIDDGEGRAGLIQSFFADIVYFNGLIFSSQGPIVDPLAWTVVANVPFGGTVAADTAAGRMYFLWGNALSAIDAMTLRTLGTVNVAGIPPLDLHGSESPVLVRWGMDGLAYRTYTELVVFRNGLGVP